MNFDESLREHLRTVLSKRRPRRFLEKLGRPAAVLVPIFIADGTARVWLLRRPAWMRAHGGQVAFPGGKADAEDKSPVETALREAREELGMIPTEIDVLGESDEYVTITGFRVTPVVGWLRSDFVPSPSGDEVARVFSVPLRMFAREPEGSFPYRGYHADGEIIWGATLAMGRHLVRLAERGLDDLP